MRVTARFFATLREARGRSEEDVDLPDACTAGQSFALLFPGLELRVAFAVNQATVPASTPLRPGDEVAFLPPLGGG